jgi:predicted secreted protein
MADVVIGYGAEWWLENSSDTLMKVAEVTSIGLPNPQQSDVEATHFESPGRTREYIAGLIDNGEITFGMNFDAGSASDTLITEAMTSGEVRDMMVSLPTSSGTNQEFTFPGIIKGYEKTVPIDDRQTATITVRVAGAVVQAAAA